MADEEKAKEESAKAEAPAEGESAPEGKEAASAEEEKPAKPARNFGAIASMEPDDYVARMREVLADDDKIYDAIMEDIHQASQVLLGRKYRLLKLSYLALILGMIATLIAVLVS